MAQFCAVCQSARLPNSQLGFASHPVVAGLKSRCPAPQAALFKAIPRAHTDQAMTALIAETEKMLRMLQGDDLRDAGLIASAQKLEHYEIAAYGTAAALAGQLDLREDQRTLHDLLEEEKRIDLLLTKL